MQNVVLKPIVRNIKSIFDLFNCVKKKEENKFTKINDNRSELLYMK